MAYDHTQTQVQFTTTAGGIALTATAAAVISAQRTPGILPEIIRGFAVMPLTAGAAYESMVVALQHIGLASGSTASAIATINGVASDKPGHVIYVDGLNVKVNPGEAYYVEVTGAATTAAADFAAQAYIEPGWEQPLNDTSMRVTT